MHLVDWLIIVVYLTYVAVDGLRRARRAKGLEGYLLANRSLPWWAVGLSVMATQLSAVTLIGTTGQGAADGMRFVQFYFGLPLAMLILGVTLVPFLHGAKVYTAYEYLERRFDAKTRSLTAFLFLLSRGFSVSTILAAPAVVFSAMFGWPISWSVAVMGVPAMSLHDLRWRAGGRVGRREADGTRHLFSRRRHCRPARADPRRHPTTRCDSPARPVGCGCSTFSFDPTKTYTFWSGLIGGTFLMLSYFGTDQSQVQRYLAAKSVDEARTSLLVSAYWKIPLQALVLLVGRARVRVLHVPGAAAFLQSDRCAAGAAGGRAGLRPPPGTYRQAFAERQLAATQLAGARDAACESGSRAARAFREGDSAVGAVRSAALGLAERASRAPARDVNYIIPHFVLTELPIGLAGLFIATVMAAAMAAIAGELNSLATATVIDFYRRWVRPEGASDTHYLAVSKVATGFWGALACVVATYAATLGSLIEVVNRFGSFFYGSILGVFLLAMWTRARPAGAFVGLLAGMGAVAAVSFGAPAVSFLWYNVVGAAAVLAVGIPLSVLVRDADRRGAEDPFT